MLLSDCLPLLHDVENQLRSAVKYADTEHEADGYRTALTHVEAAMGCISRAHGNLPPGLRCDACGFTDPDKEAPA